MNNTKSTTLKIALHKAPKFTESQQKHWTYISSVQPDIDKLLDDKKMMAAMNHFTFEQRTAMTIQHLQSTLILILTDKDGYADYAETVNAICKAVTEPHDIETSQIAA